MAFRHRRLGLPQQGLPLRVTRCRGGFPFPPALGTLRATREQEMPVPVDALIKELLQSGGMNEDTTADLNRWLAEFEAGTLHADDAAYIEALHAKVTGAPLPDVDAATPLEPARLDGLSIEDWRDRALRAEAELASLKDSISTTSA